MPDATRSARYPVATRKATSKHLPTATRGCRFPTTTRGSPSGRFDRVLITSERANGRVLITEGTGLPIGVRCVVRSAASYIGISQSHRSHKYCADNYDFSSTQCASTRANNRCIRERVVDSMRAGKCNYIQYIMLKSGNHAIRRNCAKRRGGKLNLYR